jgi:hypothetical protein
MRAAREVRGWAGDDVHSLGEHMHATRAAKEGAERALGAAVAVYDQVGGGQPKPQRAFFPS